VGAAVVITSGNGAFGDLTDWKVQDDASPTIIGDSGGSAGTLELGALTKPKSIFLDGAGLTLTDPRYGTFSAIADTPSISATTLSLAGNGLLGQLNITKTAAPVFGTSTLSDAFNAYISLCFVAPPAVNFTATSNPVVAFPGWTAVVLDMVKALAATYRIEIAVVSGVITIRDINSATLDITNVTDGKITRDIVSTDIALTVDVTYQNTVSVASAGANIHNFSTNPGVETSAAGWSAAYTGGATGGSNIAGAMTASGRSTTTFQQGTASFSATMTEAVRSILGGGYQHTIDVTFTAPFTNVGGVLPNNFGIYYRLAAQPGGQSSYSSAVTPSVKWLNSVGGTISTIVGSGTGATGSFPYAAIWNNGGGVMTANPPPGAVSGQYILHVKSSYIHASSSVALTGQIVYADAFMATESGNGTYQDGASAGWSWLGTTNLSASVGANPDNIAFYDALADNNTVYTVNAGVTDTIIIQTTNSPSTLVQPIRTSILPIGVGQYYMSGADNLPIVSGQWEAYGGSVSVAVGTDPGTIALTLHGPTSPIPGVQAPYSLAAYDGTNSYAQLSIAGAGVKTSPGTLTLPTGADPTRTQNQTGAQVNIPFIQNIGQAYDRGQELASHFAGALHTISFRLAYNDAEAFGLMQGSRVTYQNGIYRVMTCAYDATGCDVVAGMRVIGSDFDAAWTGFTGAQFDAFWAGYTDADMIGAPLWHP
jgi:hypothetical protein